MSTEQLAAEQAASPSIPAEIADMNHFCCVSGRGRSVAGYHPVTGAVVDQSTLVSYDTARVGAVMTGGRVGFVPPPESGYAGLAVAYYDNGVPVPPARELVGHLASYAVNLEDGVHVLVLVRSTSPIPRVFSSDRPVWTQTGVIDLGVSKLDGAPLVVAEADLGSLIGELTGGSGLSPEDAELLDKMIGARNSQRVRMYYDSSPRVSDQNAAEEELCRRLAWWCDRDVARVDRLFRASSIFDPARWDRVMFPATGMTRGRWVIDRAVSNVNEGYRPSKKGRTTHRNIGAWDQVSNREVQS
ncbi:MAG: hypothetical protein GHCLOJNM_01591 [bacterium]|nr:hypothetical protein [bacterium]